MISFFYPPQPFKLVVLLSLIVSIVITPSDLLAERVKQIDSAALPLFVIDKDYRQASIRPSKHEIDQSADITFFYWYGSEASRQVELTLIDYLQKKNQSETSLTIERVPLVAHLNWRPQAYLQPMLDQLNKSNLLPGGWSENDIYEACINDCSIFKDYQSVKHWLMTEISLKDFEFDESSIWQSEKKYRKTAESFSISQVPTILIRGTYIVDANSAKSLERMIRIIDFLLAKTNPNTQNT